MKYNSYCCFTDSKGDTWVTYEKNTEDSEVKVDINKNLLDTENFQLNEKITEDGTNEIEIKLNNK